ncbi:LytTR family transcriptional regulator DNA-binding domain-containing protein [Spirosoma gilvum]
MQVLDKDTLPTTSRNRHFPITPRAVVNRSNQIRLPGLPRPIAHSSIIRLMGFGNYSWVYLTEQAKPILIAQTLKRFEDQLTDFVRIHKSEMINPQFVHKIKHPDNITLEVSLIDGYTTRISRRRIRQVLEKLVPTTILRNS